ncbi:MAG: NAD-dependent epimerase/dehydratase family protein, partial [Gemmatimonadetes bacterium]|nr:NAD-dependent epimerase/dehydratase family protein [Gemmatimonadota bacterium]
MSSPRFLVTGATGFIGSHLVRRLVAEQAHVTMAVRADSDPWRVTGVLDQVGRVDLDLED